MENNGTCSVTGAKAAWRALKFPYAPKFIRFIGFYPCHSLQKDMSAKPCYFHYPNGKLVRSNALSFIMFCAFFEISMAFHTFFQYFLSLVRHTRKWKIKYSLEE